LNQGNFGCNAAAMRLQRSIPFFPAAPGGVWGGKCGENWRRSNRFSTSPKSQTQ
jgi:hypothetical protein